MSAPMQAASRPAIYRFMLGAFEITAFLDGAIVRSGLAASHGQDTSSPEFQALASENGIETNRYEHVFIPLLVNTGKELVLFDTGSGALAREHAQFQGRLPPGALVERMRESGYAPENVDIVVITHGHPDHIGGLTEGGARVFRNARYIFGAAEFEFWKLGIGVRDERRFNRELFMRIAAPLAEDATFVAPGDEIVSGIRAVDATGHSPGMMAYLIESDGKRLLNWADTCGHYVISVQRPDLHLDVDDDKEKAASARLRILEMAADQQLLVAGYHMPFPGIGYVARAGRGFRWTPHTYQMSL